MQLFKPNIFIMLFVVVILSGHTTKHSNLSLKTQNGALDVKNGPSSLNFFHAHLTLAVTAASARSSVLGMSPR